MTESVDKSRPRAADAHAPLNAPAAGAPEAQPRRTDAPADEPAYSAAPGEPVRLSPHTPLEDAQALMHRAWEATGRTRIRLARKALSLSRDCADAYVLLGDETARSLEEACALYEQGVKAGERALGTSFERLAGGFWDDLARPYMRARYALADCLWALGQSQQAITHLADMLRLNPTDEQGIRYVLARFLLETEADEALGELLQRYRGDSGAFMAYTRALAAYRAEGASFRAEVLLRAALVSNYYVPGYLLGRRPIPYDVPSAYALGREDEAVTYATEFVGAWAMSGDALDWLANHTTNPRPHRGH
ncbi:MAG: tetratricopeptide repeat protein [Chloroflexi bacterium]|nr:tetratricopeptide repeat protein [Chloroflexota bacterium]